MIYVWISLFVLIWLFILYTKTAHYKGWSLERKIDQILNRMASKYGGIAYKDLLIPYNGATSQIDNVLLTDKALYVIEAKNYNGYIYGSLTDQNWTLTQQNVKTYKNKRGKKYTKSFINKHSFYNPIKQNTIHINALKTLLKNPNALFINIVVFGQKTQLKNVNSDPQYPVIRLNQLKAFINRNETKMSSSISLQSMSQWVDSIVYANDPSRKARKNHIKQLKKRYKA